MEANCKTCGRTLTTYPSKPRVYCSKACWTADPDRVRSGRAVIERVIAICKTCGKQIDVLPSKAARKKYCSRSCRSKDPEIILKLRRSGQMVKCDGCGKEFWKSKSITFKRNFCSVDCEKKRIQVACDNCGSILDRIAGAILDHNFCNRKCLREFYAPPIIKCEWCEKEFSRKEYEILDHVFCGRACYNNWIVLSEEAEPTRQNRRMVMLRSHQNEEFLQKRQEAWGSGIKANKLEGYIGRHFPEMHFVGNGKLWVTLKDGRRKCPDFKVHGRRKFLEIWGDFWHKDENPDELEQAYREIGFECIVVWESEIRKDWRKTVLKINRFLLL